METNSLWNYLNDLVARSVFPVCFSGDKECILNRWLVKSQQTYQEEDDGPGPELFPEGEVILLDDTGFISGQMLESKWRYYISDLKDYAYTYNAPQTLFSQEEEKHIYCVAGVYCSDEQDMLVYCGMTSPAPIKIWINGRLVFINHDNYAVKKAYVRFKFSKGKNILLVERPIKSHGIIPSKDRVGFCVKLKPYKQLFEYTSEIPFINEGLLTGVENSYQIVPRKLVFSVEEDISLMVLPKYFTGDRDEKIRVSLLNSRDEELVSLDAVTSENLSVKLDAKVYGIVNIKVTGLERDRKSCSMVFCGDFRKECDRMIKQASNRADFSRDIMDIMRGVAEMSDYSRPADVYNGLADHRISRYKFLKYLEFERYIREPEAEVKKNKFDVFKSGLISGGTAGNGITYWIHLPRTYVTEKEYPLVIYLLNRADESIYPECPDFILNGEFGNTVVVCMGGMYGQQNNYADNLNIISVISEISGSLNINRGKIYLIGAQDGAAKSINLLLRMPHLFTAVAVFNGLDSLKTDKPDTLFYKNAANTMFYQIYSIDHHGVNGIRALDILEHMERKKSWLINGFHEDELCDMFNSEKLLNELLKENRPNYPRKIDFNTSEPVYNRSFWAKIEYIEDLGYIAGIKAEIKADSQIEVNTYNVQRFSLLIDRENMGLENAIDINVNNTKVTLCTDKYAKIEFNLDTHSPGFEIHQLSRCEFDREYLSTDIKGNQLGIKEICLDKYLIVRPEDCRYRKKVFFSKLLNTLKNLQNRVNNSYTGSVVFEGEINNGILSSSNFIYVIDCHDTSHVFQKIWKNTELEFDSVSIKFRDNRFRGEYFAIIKLKNPYNPEKITLLCIYNSENAAEELVGFLRTFNWMALFYSEAIISNNGNYYSYR
jgi:esterase/lipase superfamily enzyme